MKLIGLMVFLLASSSLGYSQEATSPVDSPAGLVIVKAKRERRREQPMDVRHTATDPDALQNTGIMPSGGGSNFPTFVYEYSAEIRNDSTKTVKWLTLMYVLSDPESKQELDRREFSSFDKIAAGQKKTVKDTQRIQPMQPGAADPKKKDERMQFVCVAFDDGTLWHASFLPESHCRDAEKRGKSK
jgi:hypothetical protein